MPKEYLYIYVVDTILTTKKAIDSLQLPGENHSRYFDKETIAR